MHTASSANRTCRLSRSAVLYTATVLMPISRAVRITRRAISPRLAMRIFLNMAVSFSPQRHRGHGVEGNYNLRAVQVEGSLACLSGIPLCSRCLCGEKLRGIHQE